MASFRTTRHLLSSCFKGRTCSLVAQRRRTRLFSTSEYTNITQSARRVDKKWVWSVLLGATAIGSFTYSKLRGSRGKGKIWPRILASEEEKKDPPKVRGDATLIQLYSPDT